MYPKGYRDPKQRKRDEAASREASLRRSAAADEPIQRALERALRQLSGTVRPDTAVEYLVKRDRKPHKLKKTVPGWIVAHYYVTRQGSGMWDSSTDDYSAAKWLLLFTDGTYMDRQHDPRAETHVSTFRRLPSIKKYTYTDQDHAGRPDIVSAIEHGVAVLLNPPANKPKSAPPNESRAEPERQTPRPKEAPRHGGGPI